MLVAINLMRGASEFFNSRRGNGKKNILCSDGKNFCLVKDIALAIKQYALIAINTKAVSTSQSNLFVKVRRYELSTKHQASGHVVTKQHYWLTCAT